MGLFDVLGGKEHPIDFLVGTAGKGLKAGASLAGKGIKAGINAAKNAKQSADDANDDNEDDESDTATKFCPHCGKPL